MTKSVFEDIDFDANPVSRKSTTRLEFMFKFKVTDYDWCCGENIHSQDTFVHVQRFCLSEDLCVGLSWVRVMACALRPLGVGVGHPRPPRCSGPWDRGCPCRDPLNVPSDALVGGHREQSANPLWLCCVGGSGPMTWTSCIHAFSKHTSSTREVRLLSFRVAPWYHPGQNKYRYRSEIKSKTIGLYQITDVTDLY